MTLVGLLEPDLDAVGCAADDVVAEGLVSLIEISLFLSNEDVLSLRDLLSLSERRDSRARSDRPSFL